MEGVQAGSGVRIARRVPSLETWRISVVQLRWHVIGSQTQVLHILISSQSHGATLLATTSACSCTVGLVDNDSIGSCGSDKSGTIGVSSPGTIRMEGDIG